jgi:hypothetical protein
MILAMRPTRAVRLSLRGGVRLVTWTHTDTGCQQLVFRLAKRTSLKKVPTREKCQPYAARRADGVREVPGRHLGGAAAEGCGAGGGGAVGVHGEHGGLVREYDTRTGRG